MDLVQLVNNMEKDKIIKEIKRVLKGLEARMENGIDADKSLHSIKIELEHIIDPKMSEGRKE